MSVDKKILIVNDLHLDFIEDMEETGFKVDYRPDITKSEIYEIIPNYHGLVIRSKMYIDADFLSKADKLEFIGRAGAGIDNIDEKAVSGTNIKIFNAPEGNRDAVGEHAIGMILSLFNNLNKGHREVTAGIWDREGNRGLELGGMTVGILGYGNTGRALAKKLQGFGCRILAFDKYRSDIEESYVELVSLEEFYKESNVVSIHIPLTSETTGCINAEFFEAFGNEIFIINTSRGKVLALNDLLYCLDKGKVQGACLDVLENEKLDALSETEKRTLDKLNGTGKVLFSPHVAGWTFESYRKISEVLSKKILNHYMASSRIA